MKKLLAIILALTMVLALFAGCTSDEGKQDNDKDDEIINNEDDQDVSGDDAEDSTDGLEVQSALEILEAIWAGYEEKFPVIGGNMEAPVDGAPGNYDMAYAEGLTYNLLIPAEQLASVDEAATMVHMMNTNSFTGGVVHLTEGTDAAAFAAAMRDAIQGNQWICGFPETLVIAVIDGEYVLIAFGVNDAMNPFIQQLSAAYPDAEVLYNEAIAG